MGASEGRFMNRPCNNRRRVEKKKGWRFSKPQPFVFNLGAPKQRGIREALR
jgi:hypothetical protein